VDFFKRLVKIIFAIFLIAFSVNMFLGPHDIAAGGITGLAIILEAAAGFSRSITVLIFNIAILILTFFTLGRKVFLNTLIGSALLPVGIWAVPHVTLVQNSTLSMAAGSVIFGLAVALLYYNNASSGGTAVPPLILQKYFNLNPAVGLFITDGLVVILTIFVFGTDQFFYAIFSIFITSATMRYLEDGLTKKKKVHIISDFYQEILTDVINKIGRGVTVIPIFGGYRNDERKMLMITLTRRDYKKLAAIVKNHDKNAFMITDTVTDVIGEGFTYESGSV